MRLILSLIFLIFLFGCKPEMTRSTQNENAKLPQASGRDSWQKPELVINALGDLTGKTILDIGAGTGYFTFRMAFGAERVIAVDIDPNMIDLINFMRENLPADIQKKIETRLVTPDDPGIKPDEADIAIIINTIAYLDNPIVYLNNLGGKLKKGGKLAVIDFKKKYTTIDAPPFEERLDSEEVVAILSKAGYQEIEVDDRTLEFQYIITANR